ncbi:S1 family peptidase [Kitasatospora azatica]|uniref:S1 family peptidase n=1 Tax=Kitasatospora azatica TaxID=58347 RepID=UPI00056801E0|nr:serine protease [Kitasatospora azatica]
MKSLALPKTLAATAAAAALVLAAPSAIASANAGPSAGPHIVGGGSASQSYSFMVSLQLGGQHYCGASLISANWAVTAAHCVEGHTADEYTVRVGSADRAAGGETGNVSRIVAHPDYNTTNDIALIQLAQPVRAIPIAIADSAEVGSATRLLGWGQETPQPGGDNGPDQLKELDTALVGAGCGNGYDPGTELCVNSPQGPDGSNQGACYGDSGGPAITQVNGEWRLIGATSRSGGGSRCAADPSIYTNVTAYKEFIQNAMAG